MIQPAYDIVIQRGTDEFVVLVFAFETHGPQRCNHRHQFGIQGVIDYPADALAFPVAMGLDLLPQLRWDADCSVEHR